MIKNNFKSNESVKNYNNSGEKRQSLNKVESLSDIYEIDNIPLRDRYDQDPRNFI